MQVFIENKMPRYYEDAYVGLDVIVRVVDNVGIRVGPATVNLPSNASDAAIKEAILAQWQN